MKRTNVLITGMTASQSSMSANNRSLAFAGALRQVLLKAGDDVTIAIPELFWTAEDLVKYDAVLVGIAPFTSLSANNAYGALQVADLLKDSSKLTFFVDAPRPDKIETSATAVIKRPANLVKPFYKNRRDYAAAVRPKTAARLFSTLQNLAVNPWPRAIYPALPWDQKNKYVNSISPQVTGVNLDAYLVRMNKAIVEERIKAWVIDSPNTPWSTGVTKTLMYDAHRMKQHKGWSDEQIEYQASYSLGALISPYSDGTWWSTQYAQCLGVLTPVVTHWEESSLIGASWDVLASRIEDMTDTERRELALEQRNSYLRNTPSRQDALDIIKMSIGL